MAELAQRLLYIFIKWFQATTKISMIAPSKSCTTIGRLRLGPLSSQRSIRLGKSRTIGSTSHWRSLERWPSTSKWKIKYSRRKTCRCKPGAPFPRPSIPRARTLTCRIVSYGAHRIWRGGFRSIFRRVFWIMRVPWRWTRSRGRTCSRGRNEGRIRA